MTLLYKYDNSGLRPFDSALIQKFMTGSNDDIFIIQGLDNDVYIIDDPVLILEFKAIADVFPETEAVSLMRKKVNPGKYGKR